MRIGLARNVGVAALLAVLLAACQSTGTSGSGTSSEASAPAPLAITTGTADGKLTGRILEEEISRNRFEGTDQNGQKMAYTFIDRRGNKKIKAQFYRPDGSMSSVHEGSWWAIDDRVCRTLPKLENQYAHCYTVTKIGDTYRFIDGKNQAFLRMKMTERSKRKSSNSTSANKISPAYAIGWMLGYSEICREFTGLSLDNLIARSIREKFQGNTSFQKGFDVFSIYSAYDQVSGLEKCEEYNAVLTKIGRSN